MYFLGHSDVVMGLISVNRTDLYEKLKYLQNGEFRIQLLLLSLSITCIPDVNNIYPALVFSSGGRPIPVRLLLV